MSNEYLKSIEIKEKKAHDRCVFLRRRKECLESMKPLQNFSNKILTRIYRDYLDIVPMTEIALKMKQLKEDTKDPNDDRLYKMVKEGLTIENHPVIKEFMNFSNLSVKESLFYLQMSNFGINKAKELYL